MNNTIQRFNFNNLQVRTVILNNEPWFVAGDVAHVLELSNTSSAVSKLEDDERSKFNLGRQGNVNIVNEYGLYNLILASRKPSAKKFQRWVTHEVLPQIRKTGSYSIMSQQQVDESDIRVLQLKAKHFDDYVEQQALINSCYNLTDATAEIGLKYGELSKLLVEYEFAYYGDNSKIIPFPKYENDLFFIKKFNQSKNKELSQTLIRPKGLETFRVLFGNTKQLSLFN
jgi:Prophage antirepressor